jgi:transposase
MTMRQKPRSAKEPAEQVVKEIRRATRKHYSAEEKIRIVLEGLRGEDSIAREATSDEVRGLRREAAALKEVVADLTLENRLLKKAWSGMGRTAHEVPGLREDQDHPSGRAVPSVRA